MLGKIKSLNLPVSCETETLQGKGKSGLRKKKKKKLLKPELIKSIA